MNCTCPHIKIGSQVTEQRNWNPDCLEHGVKSAWWNSPERVKMHKQDSQRLRDLQRAADEARRKSRDEKKY